MERPEGGEWSYEYDGADRLTAVANPEADRTEYTWICLITWNGRG